MSEYRISELAQRTGFPASTLRFYETNGLLPADRTSGGYRRYDDSAVERLRMIAAGKGLGLDLEEIRELLVVWERGACAEVRSRLRPLVRARIGDGERRIAELSAFVDALTGVGEELAGPAPDGPCGPDCGCVRATPPSRGLSPTRDVGAGPEPAPVACTLGAADEAVRRTEWARLIETATEREHTDAGVRLLFPLDDGLAGQVARLAAAEQECCAFLDFTLRFTAAGLELTVGVPPEAGDILGDLFGPADRANGTPER